MNEGDGRLCGKDAANVLDLLRKTGFYKFGDKVVFIQGPLRHYNHKLEKVVRAKHHMVGQIAGEFVIDAACEPGKRIYLDMDDYKKNSGIQILTNKS